MKQLKSLLSVFIILLVILVFVFARTSNKNLFKQDSKNAIEDAKNGNNLILSSGLENLSTPYLIVHLGNNVMSKTIQSKNTINIPFENLLDKSNQKSLQNIQSKIILFSEDISTTSKAWVILNQLGFENIYILQSEVDTEAFKYKFQPDTSAKLE